MRLIRRMPLWAAILLVIIVDIPLLIFGIQVGGELLTISIVVLVFNVVSIIYKLVKRRFDKY